MVKPTDPLKFVPSAAAVRQRLQATTELARKLRILLRTAERIERSRDERQGVANG